MQSGGVELGRSATNRATIIWHKFEYGTVRYGLSIKTCLAGHSLVSTSRHVDVKEQALDAWPALLIARRHNGTVRPSMLTYCRKGAVPGLGVKPAR